MISIKNNVFASEEDYNLLHHIQETPREND